MCVTGQCGVCGEGGAGLRVQGAAGVRGLETLQVSSLLHPFVLLLDVKQDLLCGREHTVRSSPFTCTAIFPSRSESIVRVNSPTRLYKPTNTDAWSAAQFPLVSVRFHVCARVETEPDKDAGSPEASISC